MVHGTVVQRQRRRIPTIQTLGGQVLGQCRRSLGTGQSWDSAVLGRWSWDSTVLGQWSWDSGLGTVVLGQRSWDSAVLGQWSWDSTVLGQWSWESGLGTVVLGQ